MSLLTPILRPTLRSALSSITSAIRRYFTDFDPVAQTYVQLSSPIVLTGDFEFECDFAVTGSPSSSNNLFNFGSYLVRVQSDTQIRVWGDFNMAAASFNVPSIGNKLNKLKVIGSAASGNVSIVLNDVEYGPLTGSVPNFSGSDYFIGQWSGSFFDGIIANVKVRDAATTVLDMPLDGSDYESSAIVANKQTVLGSEIVTNGNFVDGSNNWATGGSGSPTVSTTDGQASVEATVTGSAIFEQSLTLSSASTYIIDVTLVGQTAGFPSVYYFTGSSALIGALSEGRNRLIFTPSSDATKLRIGFLGNIDAGEYFTIDDVSIREIPAATPLGTAINFAAADTELYTLQNGAWVSDTKTIPVA